MEFCFMDQKVKKYYDNVSRKMKINGKLHGISLATSPVL